jgi:hypothetical protein
MSIFLKQQYPKPTKGDLNHKFILCNASHKITTLISVKEGNIITHTFDYIEIQEAINSSINRHLFPTPVLRGRDLSYMNIWRIVSVKSLKIIQVEYERKTRSEKIRCIEASHTVQFDMNIGNMRSTNSIL